jgi:hypothetical protein
MKLSRDEESFLRHWIYDEAHYQDRRGPAKGLQLQHMAVPADLGTLIAAAIPDPPDQEAAGLGPPPREPLTWPWSAVTLRARLAEARIELAKRRGEAVPGTEIKTGQPSGGDAYAHHDEPGVTR